jgi:hypothetical protein
VTEVETYEVKFKSAGPAPVVLEAILLVLKVGRSYLLLLCVLIFSMLGCGYTLRDQVRSFVCHPCFHVCLTASSGPDSRFLQIPLWLHVHIKAGYHSLVQC